ncbi:MAG: hypothetical protein WC254_05760 [Candidatus Woesearchaeota archaeon]|jgi:hypothetical protein
MEPWYSQLEFSENPLDARPNAQLIGLEEQEQQIKNFILKEELCFLNGLTGAGKTSLLKRVQDLFTDYSFIYLDADALPPSFNLTEALRGKRTLFDMIRLKEMPTKKTVLIIDEFQATDPRIILEARSKWENPTERHIKSIIIAQISEQLKNVPGSFKDRLGNRIVRLTPLNNDVMKQVLENRLSNSKTGVNYYKRLNPQAIDFLVAVADGNVRRLLEYTDLIFDFHYQRFKDSNPLARTKDYTVTFPAAKEILIVNNIPVDGYVPEIIKKHSTSKIIDQSPAKQKPIAETDLQTPVAEVSEPTRVMQTFDKEFTLAEQNVLRSVIRHEPMTLKQIATDIHLEINKCNGVIANLKKKNAIVSTTKISGDKSWQLTESAKRAMVTK